MGAPVASVASRTREAYGCATWRSSVASAPLSVVRIRWREAQAGSSRATGRGCADWSVDIGCPRNFVGIGVVELGARGQHTLAPGEFATMPQFAHGGAIKRQLH